MLLDAGKILLYEHIEACQRASSSGYNDWKMEAAEALESRLSDNNFPCLFARKAYNNRSIRLLFVDSHSLKNDLVDGFNQYIDFINETPLKNRIYAPLAVFFEKNFNNNLKSEHIYSWKALQILHENDTESWPSNIPSSPDSPDFTYCYKGIQLFINISCPSHKKMRSRNLGPYITFIVNPRRNFDLVASSQNLSGIKIRERIRSRTSQYNNGHTPTTLGFFGDQDSLEWRQYQLEEPGGLSPDTCPLNITTKKRKD